MDNQKPNDGNARNLGNEGSGSSMGKDLGSNRAGGSTSGPGGATGGLGSSSAAETMSNKAKELANDAVKSASDLHKTIDKAADAAQPTVDRLASSAHATVDKVTGALSGASESMDERARQLTDAYKNFTSTGREYVRTSPGTSILVALAAGFTLSKLLSRRNRY